MKLQNYLEKTNSQTFQKLGSFEKVEETLIAFANSKGGEIFLELQSNNLAEVLKSKNEIYKILQDKFSFLFVITEILWEGDSFALLLTVSEAQSKPVYLRSKGILAGSFTRFNDENRLLTTIEQEILAIETSGKSFDSLPLLSAKTSDLDFSFLEKMLPKDLQINLFLSKQTLCEQFGLIQNNGIPIPTVAGILLLGKETQSFAELKNAFTEVKKGKQNLSFTGNLIEQIIKISLEAEQWFKNPSIKNAFLVLLQNAVLHRDYTKQTPIKIELNENSFKICSPGFLPFGVELESKNSKKIPRNEKIYYFFKVLGNTLVTNDKTFLEQTTLMKSYFDGNFVVECELKEAVKTEKLYAKTENNLVNFAVSEKDQKVGKNEPLLDENELLPRQKEALLFFNESNQLLTRKSYQEKFKVSQKTANLDLVKLEQLQVITRFGKARSVHYKINKN
ncbi:hypothetical protein IT568_11270 [bacterium]|nr:hypothetical protein [bacterium]